MAIGITELKLASYALDRQRSCPIVALACLRRESTLRLFPGCLTSFAASWDIGALPPFAQVVLKFLTQVSYSETRSSTWIARKLGKPKAAGAAGNALARNLLPIIVPCHRIVRAGAIGGAFALASEWQKKLLNPEKRYAKSATSRK